MKSVETALSRAGLPPERLELEITESLFLQENELIRATLRQIQEWGVTLALDDFGTGYSSLNYLRRFRVDKIKIDRSFIAEMHVDTDSMAIVRAVASLAQNLDIRLNAEGIETHAQLVILKLLGCHEAQGFIFGRPVPEAEAFRLIEASESPSRYGARAS
jgi:EAL domain-containing protein (putative c-di-GMP-specific phosphodiesterase class I)